MWCYWAHNATDEEEKLLLWKQSWETSPIFATILKQTGLSQEIVKEDGYFAR